MWNVTYHLKPLSLAWLPYSMRSMAFQCNHSPFAEEPNGFFSTSMTNVPAFQEEPYMPPEDNLRAWVLIYYEEDKKIDPATFWKELGKSDYARFKPLTNADGLVKRTAAELVFGLDKDEEKLAAIDRFCRTKIRNVTSGAFHLTAEERKSIKDNHSAGDTLKQKAGSGRDVDQLFVALVNAAGFDARMARISDRSDFFFTEARPTTYFLDIYSVAVKVARPVDLLRPIDAVPGTRNAPLAGGGQPRADLRSQGRVSLLKPSTPTPARSKSVRRGTFKLLEDGTLEGSVQYTYAGHAGRLRKTRYQEMTPAKQEEDWKEALKDRLSTAGDVRLRDSRM